MAQWRVSVFWRSMAAANGGSACVAAWLGGWRLRLGESVVSVNSGSAHRMAA